MKDLYIKEIDSQDPEYQKLVLEKGGIFNDPAWTGLFGKKLHLAGIFDGESLIGAFTLFYTRIFGFTYIKNPVTTPHSALIYRNDTGNRHRRNSREKAIHTTIAKYLRKLNPGIIQFNLPPEVTDVQPYLWQGFKVSPTFTYRLDLHLDIDQIIGQFDGKLRSDISKAQKDRLDVQLAEDPSEIGMLVKSTFKRQKIQVSGELIDRILERFSSPYHSFGFIARQDGRAVAAVFCIFDRTTAYYILGGYDPESRSRGAVAYALYSAINHAKELGLNTFDFEGSMIPSIESFFRGFGGELVPKFSVHRAWLPLEMVLKFVRRNIFL